MSHNVKLKLDYEMVPHFMTAGAGSHVTTKSSVRKFPTQLWNSLVLFIYFDFVMIKTA